ncbi:MAG: 2-oxo acid dehydrogenase subunit E2 [Anaerolineae bacterium]|nr:2-oxo acid dehydrogenase subunit E2 [Anaerolineae bacterium]MBL8105502.1 2-oxo acid dehydrogenase subunit E2 [Anaerolineales bacterium]MCC7189991.1 2-oxo acid dehydrogenase subunit E2 [Anaerolineales bacterium]
MAETINMPKLGFDMAEGTLVRWVKQVGENINKGDVLAEIETDKATVEVESPAGGVVLQLIVNQGDVVPVNAPIAVVGAAGEKISDQSSVSSRQSKVESGKKKEESVADEKPVQSTGQSASVPSTVSTPQASSIVHGQSPEIKASPLAKKIARDNNINLAQLQGTGPGGRVVRKDVESVISGQSSVSSKQSAPSIYQLPITAPDDEVVQLTKLRQAIARRMTESKTSVPHFYVSHEYNMGAVMAMRKQVNEYLPDNEKLSVNDFIVKAVALALREFPNINATFAGDKVVRHGAVNVGVAVAVTGGLLTVVNKNTDQLPLRQISADVKQKVARARDGKVKPDDIEGSTFSISNLGMYDVENFIAIVNPPEAAILAVGSAREVPVVESGELKVGWRMKATVSVDHRVSDGAEAAQFMQSLAKYLETPALMLV